MKKHAELKYLDLHTHTNVSDGLLSPEELVQTACKLNFQILGITDHDNLDGIDRARKEALQCGLNIVPGCELTAYYKRDEIHILAYFIEPDNRYFARYLKQFSEARYERAKTIIKKLQRLGIILDFDDIYQKYRTRVIGRAHIAREMVEKNYCKNIKSAFERYLITGKPAYVPKFAIGPRQLIELILQAGGIPVFAHPFYYFRSEELIAKLVEYGLKGLEVYHPRNTIQGIQKYKSIAEHHNLIITGGSDAHTAPKGDYLPFGTIKLDTDLLNPLLTLKEDKSLLISCRK